MAALSTRTFGSFGRSGGAARWGAFSVFVDAVSVNHVLDAVEDAVSPLALSYFLEGVVQPYFADQIVDTFADLGPGNMIGGSWPALEESTLRIRHGLGYWDDMAINERTGEMLSTLISSHDTNVEALGASLQIPGNSAFSDQVFLKKLSTAQKGYVQSSADMIPGAVTPPRPVLALGTDDVAALHVMLQTHIANWVANGFLAGGTL